METAQLNPIVYALLTLRDNELVTANDVNTLAYLLEGEWSNYKDRMGYSFCKKYKYALSENGIDIAMIPAPFGLTISDRRICYDESANLFIVKSRYDANVVAAVKRIPGRKFNPNWQGIKVWTIAPTAESLQQLIAFADIHGFIFEDNSFEIAQSKMTTATERISSSVATDADIKVEGLGCELRPFQRAGVAYGSRTQRTFIADEMGLGKTVQGLAIAQYLSAFPLLVACPASLKLNWAREAKKWLPGKRIMVVEGKNHLAREAVYGDLFADSANVDIYICNYDILNCKEETVPTIKDPNKLKKVVTLIGNASFLADVKLKSIIFDECHNLKSRKAQRTRACKLLAKNVPVRLMLTGTPVLNKAADLITQLEILGRLDDFGGYNAFFSRYCMGECADLTELNRRLREVCYIRRLKKDVLKELPPKQRSVVPLEIDNWNEYTRALNDTASWCAEQAIQNKEFLRSLEGKTEEEKVRLKKLRYEDKKATVQWNEDLVRLTALKKVTARGKMAAGIEWVRNFLDSGEKLILFANHVEIVEKLATEFNAPFINGSVAIEDRQKAVDQFQKDPDCKLIVLNLVAGGVGLTLTAASNVAFMEFGWTPGIHDQAEDRAHRIGQQCEVTAWYLVAENTIDEDIIQLLDRKRAICTAATDGDVSESGSTSILKDLVQLLSEKRS